MLDLQSFSTAGTKRPPDALISERPTKLMNLSKISAALVVALVPMRGLLAADFSVTTPNDQFAFQINGVDSPTLMLVRGQTYTFAVSTSPGFHPFHIESPGVVNNDIDSGTLTYTVPTNAENYIYFCSIHGLSMQGDIMTVAPQSAPPPNIKILNVAVGTNIVLTSTGTNTWSVIPEFSTNLVTTNWFGLTVQTNRFFGGTNETICGKPPGTEVFIRIRSQPNQ